MEEMLEKLKLAGELIGVKLYGESNFWCGIIEDFNYEFIQLRHYTKYGELDGTIIEKISKIERIDIQDDYIKSMKIVIERKDEFKQSDLKNRIYEDLNEDNWQYICLKPFEKDNSVLVSIEINNDSFYQGYINEVTQDFLVYEIIGNSGRSEGISLFKIEDVSTIKINDLECRRKLLLHKSL